MNKMQVVKTTQNRTISLRTKCLSKIKELVELKYFGEVTRVVHRGFTLENKFDIISICYPGGMNSFLVHENKETIRWVHQGSKGYEQIKVRRECSDPSTCKSSILVL